MSLTSIKSSECRIKKDLQIENQKKENAKLEFEKNSIAKQE